MYQRRFHRKITNTLALITGLIFCAVAQPTYAISTEDISTAIKEGTAKLGFRYRYESVDQDGIADEAGASTLRTRFTYTSAAIENINFGFEADYVSVVGSERFNSTENGRTRYPVVADPEGFDLNQAFLAYKGQGFQLTGGRQRVLHADQRFVGGVGWRQNEQTYDAARFQINASKAVKLEYAYVWNVNRIFGPDDGAQPSDWRSNSHFLTADYAVNDKHKLSAFGYLLDFENDNGIPNSTQTFGIAYNGSFKQLSLAARIATQTDYADSPLDYDATYMALEAKLSAGPAKFTAGYELLGSDDGLAAFRTPLATLHKFQGWADKFLLTPANGIEDVYLGIAGKIGKVNLGATWHDFSADEGSAEYGTEIDLVATLPINKSVQVQLKLADYNADDFATDTTKIWFSLMVNF